MIKKIFLVLIALFLLTFTAFYGYKFHQNKVFAEKTNINIHKAVSKDDDNFSVEQRNMTFNDGYFFIRKIEHKNDSANCNLSFHIPGKKLSVFYYDEYKKMFSLDYKFRPIYLPLNSSLHIVTDKHEMLISQAFQFKKLSDGNVVKQENRAPVIVKKEKDGYRIFYSFNTGKDLADIVWALGSEKNLKDYDNDIIYDLHDSALLYFDGYYYKSAPSYEPYEENAFFRIPSPYLATLFLNKGSDLSSDLFTQVLLNFSVENITDKGFFPVNVTSIWLKEDYGINHGYYDNRWNTDLARALLKAYKKYNIDEYRSAYLKILDFTVAQIENNKKIIKSEGGEIGYLMNDYSDASQPSRTHTSLNHQLSVINLLYDAYRTEKNDVYLKNADILLKGVEIIGDKWIKPDNNLHYAYLVDGTMGKDDYERLTYNDLLDTRALLADIKKDYSPVINTLILHKQLWICTHNVKNL